MGEWDLGEKRVGGKIGREDEGENVQDVNNERKIKTRKKETRRHRL